MHVRSSGTDRKFKEEKEDNDDEYEGREKRKRRERRRSMEVKRDLRNTVIVPTLTYASKTWAWNESQRSRV